MGGCASLDQSHDQNDFLEKQVAVVMVPFPVQGHLNQLLHLSRLLSSYNLPIHYIGFEDHIKQAKLRVHGWDLNARSTIYFQELPVPPSLNISSQISRTELMTCLFHATLQLREPVFTFLKEVSAKYRRVVIIYDSLMTCTVQDVCLIPNMEAYCFHSSSAFNTYSFIWDAITKLFPAYVKTNHPTMVSERLLKSFMKAFANLKVSSLMFSSPNIRRKMKILKNLPSIESSYPPEILEVLKKQLECGKIKCGDIHDTSRVIEGPYLDLLTKFMGNDKQWALGPFNPMVIMEKKGPIIVRRHECLEWLDKQAPNSVILISFGTSVSLSHDQINELAIGLERSQQKFIWLLRTADDRKANASTEENNVLVEAQLPEGFEKRIEGRGIIVKDWAPQLEILAHQSTGGFMSHCGWNSCMESITMGVPIAAWPMQVDQPRNAVLITEVLRIGLNVRKWDSKDNLASSMTIENVVKRLMTSLEGDDMRKNAKLLGNAIKESMVDGGATRKELDTFIAHIRR
ncbi:zeatin O-glucosyltransferase-like [Nicotiana tabacum]|uniref:Glycosyltransferase n=1 Tax=Nicotiana tabacum TaxID=4097 RepID=A0A1S3Y7Z2_TOBAC|nr:PREDICTED: zeatin O-glucosyltransferase-like [Nicotiana tabacum]WIW42797.1 UDP-glycosyltransferase [Nicotiana tabacum]